MNKKFSWIFNKRFQGVLQSQHDQENIEIFFENPNQISPTASNLVIICHPNPLAQGTMHHKIPTLVARCAHSSGYCTLRFQFCGVEKTTRSYQNFYQQVELLNELIEIFYHQGFTHPILVGFSFGGACILQSQYNGPKLAIAPAWHLMDPKVSVVSSHLNIIHAQNDPICIAQQTYENFSRMDSPSRRLVLLGYGMHFLKEIPKELLIECRYFFNNQESISSQ